MSYLLRFVQRFRADKEREFLELEKQFAKLESQFPKMPHGKRYRPYAGREPANTLIWECEFPTLEAAQEALATIQSNPEHKRLFQQQVPYFLENWTEIYQSV